MVLIIDFGIYNVVKYHKLSTKKLYLFEWFYFGNSIRFLLLQ